MPLEQKKTDPPQRRKGAENLFYRAYGVTNISNFFSAPLRLCSALKSFQTIFSIRPTWM